MKLCVDLFTQLNNTFPEISSDPGRRPTGNKNRDKDDEDNNNNQRLYFH